ncbi:MAG: HD-GYP domain-containing protein [Burkholderiales bacterium]|jgi:HD-GYP domain-containing protein (c-di-GMP phosphodiesterase class II)
MADTHQEASIRIDIRQLQPGLYVSLGGRWLEHDFLFNAFRLATQGQVDRLKASGMTHVDYWPGKSTAQPLPLADPQAAPAASDHQPRPSSVAELASTQALPGASAVPAQREARLARIRTRRTELARCERAYRESVAAVKNLMSEIFVSPAQAARSAKAVVGQTIEELLSSQHAVVHLMNDALTDPNARQHALNVTVLSLMLGREQGLRNDALSNLGLGALLHDIGKTLVASQVLLQPAEQRNRHEEAAYRQHVHQGEGLCRQLGLDAPDLLACVLQHHERMDGRGFPAGLTGDGIALSARIVAIANRYDNLCHATDVAHSLTPFEALAWLYRREASALDAMLLQRFVRCLGVWPPGTIVQLTNGTIGLVTSSGAQDSLRPTLLMADLQVPRNEALLVDLAEIPEVKIEKALRPRDVPSELLEYLSPRHGAAFFVGRAA